MSSGHADSFKDHFSATASSYAAYRPTYPRALAEFIAGQAPACGVAWDCGCGSGQLSVLLGEVFEHVIATDASDKQIVQAVPHPNVEYRVAPAESSGLGDAAVDAIVAAQAAHWFDLPAFYAEVRRVGKPGAVVALVSYGRLVLDAEIDGIVQRFYSETAGPYWPPERRHVEGGYRSLPFPFAAVETPAIDMQAEWPLPAFLGYVDTWSAVNALRQAQGTEPIDAFRRTLSVAWGDPLRARVVRWPLTIRAGRL